MAWLGSWAWRRKITIASADVGADLSNFPVCLVLSSSAGKTNVDVTDIFDEVGSNNLKIALTQADGQTQCYAEVEGWNDTSEYAALHFKGPGVSDSTSTDFYIYYDNSQADNTTYIGVVASTPGKEVWDDNFVLVMHLAETSGDYLDSTQYGNDSNVVDVTNRNRTGLLGENCPDWVRANTDNGIQIPDALNLRLTNHTLEILVFHDSWEDAEFPDMIYHREGATAAWYGLEITNSPFEVRHRWNSAGFQDYAFDISTGSWVYLAGTADTGTTTAKGYRDADAPDVDTGITNPVAGGSAITGIGYDPGSFFLDAVIDEVRISDIARPEAWVDATNLTLKDNFVTLGSAESGSSSSSSASSSSSSTSSSSRSSSSRSGAVEEWIIDTYCQDEQWIVEYYDNQKQWLPWSSSSVSSSSLSSSSSSSVSSSRIPGTVSWGHKYDVQEDYTQTFEDNWVGDGVIDGTNNNERIEFTCPPETFESEVWYLGSGRATIRHDKYQVGSGNVTKFYRTASTEGALEFTSYVEFDGVEFTSLGWVQILITNELGD